MRERPLAAGVSAEGRPDGAPEEPVPAAVVRGRLREAAESAKRDEVEEAVRRLARDREVTDAEREAVARLGARLTEAVLRGPESHLDDDDDDDAGDPEAALAVARLFRLG